MELKLKIQINPKQTIEATFEGNDIQDAVLAAGCLLDYDGICGFCKSEDISLHTRVTKEKGFKYTEFTCRGCKARRQMGEYRDGKGFFLKAWEEGWKPEDEDK